MSNLDIVENTLFLSSADASRKDMTNGRFTFQLNEPILVMRDSYAAIRQFSFINEFINISAALGNNTIYYTDDVLDATKYSIVIPDGYWSITDLDDYLTEKQTEAALNVFTLSASYATGKAKIIFDDTTTGYFLYFGADSPFALLGFTTLTYYPDEIAQAGGSTASQTVYGDTRANLILVSAIKVGTNITYQSISNRDKSNVLLQFPINAEPLAVQIVEPRNISYIPIINSGMISEIMINVYDQNNDPLLLLEDVSLILYLGPK